MAPPNSEFFYPSRSSRTRSTNSIMQSATEGSSTSSPSSTVDWPLAKTPKFKTHRGGSIEKETSEQEKTLLKDVFSCNKPRGYSSASSSEEGDSSGGVGADLQIKHNMEVFLDGLVNGFWQCQGGEPGDASVHSNINTTASCKKVYDALAQSTEAMQFQFVPASSWPPSTGEAPPIPSSSSAPVLKRKSHPPGPPKKATGKMFRRIRVKRGENIGLELFEHAKSIYISKVANEGTGLKRGMRIIAINDHPCPDSVGEAIELLGIRTSHHGSSQDTDDEYVTFVTGEEHDFETAASVVGGEEEEEEKNSGGRSVGDWSDLQLSSGYV